MGLFSALNTLAHGAQPDSYIRKKSYQFEKELGKYKVFLYACVSAYITIVIQVADHLALSSKLLD